MSDERDEGKRRRPERIGDLLPPAARALGLDDELALALAMSAWERMVAARAPAAAGACRLTALARGIATVETREPIVAQEIRLRSLELAAALRDALAAAGVAAPVREIRVAVRRS